MDRDRITRVDCVIYLLKIPFDSPTDGQGRLQWEKVLEKKVWVAGAKALKALK